MDDTFRFEKLLVYQKALDFSFRIYLITNSWPPTYRFNLSDQLQRASLSISLNIAEGTSRSNKDFRHFLGIARGSCYECIPLLSMAQKLKLIKEIDREKLYNELKSLSKMLSSLRTSIR